MTKRQKHKGSKRPRSWHHRGTGPDKAFALAMERIDPAMTTNESKVMDAAVNLAREGVETFHAEDVIYLACNGNDGKRIAIRNALTKLILKGYLSGSVPKDARNDLLEHVSHYYAKSLLHSEPEAIASRHAWEWVELYVTQKPNPTTGPLTNTST